MKKLRYHRTIAQYHLVRLIPVMCRIEHTLSVGNDTDSRQVIVQGSPVGSDIDTIGQAAHDMNIGAVFCQIIDNAVDAVSAVRGILACTDNGKHLGRIEICSAPYKQNQGSITTFP